ncbi:MAG: amidophosphoribosyltransferase [Spirochaetes bacterium]|nr:amidophosphoribosyltransferase [Spirochaetota bacterium]
MALLHFQEMRDSRPREECGIFGIYGHENASNLVYLGLYSLQHRGQESAGIASSNGKYIYRFAGMGKVTDVFKEEDINSLVGNMAVGHNRYSTTGSSYLRNAQPLRVDSILGPMVLSHNGNLVNVSSLRSQLEREGSIFQTSIDSEIVVHLMAKSGLQDFLQALICALEQIRGAYSLLIMTKNTIYAVRDPNGFRPLVLGRLGEAYVVASETCALDIIDAEYIREVEPGELIEINEKGLKSYFPFKKRKQSLCIFEYIYFSRPDSIIFGNSVYDMRIALGRMLARQWPVKADTVLPIPDSSNCAALGYSKESGIPYEIGMIRSHYIGRTFIEPSQRIRDFGAKIKYNVVKPVIKDKSIVLVDDSIMRGTTMVKIIKMFKKAGAREIHVRISSPPTRHPCFYGIDIPTHNELIASSNTIEEIRKYLGVDSIQYLTVESMLASVDRSRDFCTACFDGKYPVEYEQSDDNQKYLFEDESMSKYY